MSNEHLQSHEQQQAGGNVSTATSLTKLGQPSAEVGHQQHTETSNLHLLQGGAFAALSLGEPGASVHSEPSAPKTKQPDPPSPSTHARRYAASDSGADASDSSSAVFYSPGTWSWTVGPPADVIASADGASNAHHHLHHHHHHHPMSMLTSAVAVSGANPAMSPLVGTSDAADGERSPPASRGVHGTAVSRRAGSSSDDAWRAWARSGSGTDEIVSELNPSSGSDLPSQSADDTARSAWWSVETRSAQVEVGSPSAPARDALSDTLAVDRLPGALAPAPGSRSVAVSSTTWASIALPFSAVPSSSSAMSAVTATQLGAGAPPTALPEGDEVQHALSAAQSGAHSLAAGPASHSTHVRARSATTPGHLHDISPAYPFVSVAPAFSSAASSASSAGGRAMLAQRKSSTPPLPTATDGVSAQHSGAPLLRSHTDTSVSRHSSTSSSGLRVDAPAWNPRAAAHAGGTAGTASSDKDVSGTTKTTTGEGSKLGVPTAVVITPDPTGAPASSTTTSVASSSPTSVLVAEGVLPGAALGLGAHPNHDTSAGTGMPTAAPAPPPPLPLDSPPPFPLPSDHTLLHQSAVGQPAPPSLPYSLVGAPGAGRLRDHPALNMHRHLSPPTGGHHLFPHPGSHLAAAGVDPRMHHGPHFGMPHGAMVFPVGLGPGPVGLPPHPSLNNHIAAAMGPPAGRAQSGLPAFGSMGGAYSALGMPPRMPPPPSHPHLAHHALMMAQQQTRAQHGPPTTSLPFGHVAPDASVGVGGDLAAARAQGLAPGGGGAHGSAAAAPNGVVQGAAASAFTLDGTLSGALVPPLPLDEAMEREHAATTTAGDGDGDSVAGLPHLGSNTDGKGAVQRVVESLATRRPGGPQLHATPARFRVDLDRIMLGADTRTTVMIRNIPNKYTQAMLVQEVSHLFAGQLDFLYLPIDFRNKCNMGYAFVNLAHPTVVVPFFQAFHGRRWPRFNSEKVCEISFGRIQGLADLIRHFQRSTVMHQPPEYRPLLFETTGHRRGLPVPFPVLPVPATA